MSRQFRYEVKIELAMKVGRKRYGSPKTAAMAISLEIADQIAIIKFNKMVKIQQNMFYSYYGYKQLLAKKAYRRVKPIVEKAFANYVKV